MRNGDFWQKAISRVVAVSVLVLSVGACSASPSAEVDSESSGNAGDRVESEQELAESVSSMTTSTPTTSLVLPSTTSTSVPAPSTTVTTTTLPLTRETLRLSESGVGPVAFGAPIAEVLEVIGPLLGGVDNDTLVEYPVERGSRHFDEYEDYSFDFPFSRQLCFENWFCLWAAGETVDSLALVGWSQNNSSEAIATDSGLSIGLSLSEVEGVDLGWVCYGFASGKFGEIELGLASLGEPFVSFDDEGSLIEGSPDPSEVVITRMAAGVRPVSEFNDC